MKKLNVVFFGTPEFSLPVLETLANHPNVNLVSVVTMPNRPAGRGQKLTSPPVALYAKEKKIPLFQTDNINNEEKFLNDLNSKNIDLFIVLAFAQFLKNKVLNIPKIGCFNIHTSLLPKYRGAAPIQYALLNGDQTTGVSIQKMVLKMDAGDLVHSQEVKINPQDNFETLSSRLKNVAAEALEGFLKKVFSNQIILSPQSSNEVSFAPTIQKENGQLKFKEKSDKDLINQIRAYTPWPSAFCFLNDKRMKVLSAEKVLGKNLRPGQVDISSNQLMIGCQSGTIRLVTVQLEGKKPCQDGELLNGIKNKQVSIS